MDFRVVVWALLSIFLFHLSNSKKTVYVGGIFPGNGRDEEMTFRYAINRFNMFNPDYLIKPYIHRVAEEDSFKVGRDVCEMIEKGIAAIFASDETTSEIIQSVATTLEIPQFQTFWHPKLASFSSLMPDKPIQVFNLYPDSHTLAKAFATLLREMKWKSYTILYENEDGLVRLQEILKLHGPKNSLFNIEKLEPSGDHRPLLKKIKASSETQIILDCETDHILDILEQAKEVKLMEDHFSSYLLTSLDSHTVDFSKLRLTRTNITTLRIVDPNSASVRQVVQDWELGELNRNSHIRIATESVRVKPALMYDAINLFVTLFSKLYKPNEIFINPISCSRNDSSNHGIQISAHLLMTPLTRGELPGPVTGPIQFNSLGLRKNFVLSVVELYENRFRPTATWNSELADVIEFAINETERQREFAKEISKQELRVVSRLGPPYLMERAPVNGSVFEGNDRFEGYSIDLIDGIAKVLNFTYRFHLVEDNNYGSFNRKTKEWNGLIRELLDWKADLAICDLTITYERRTAVDFTMPFMTLGISILYSKAAKAPPDLFSFMQPLSLDVWLYMATAYLGVSIMIFLVARLAPADWENPHPCDQEPEELENIWTIKNCLWLTLGSLMAQGSDILPKGISTRMVAGMWWFFSLIMTASYTANLAAFLTMERMEPSIESAEDLVKQTKIKYGSVKDGATAAFFKDSNFSTYQRMWQQMQIAQPSVFEKSNAEGVKRVSTSKRLYAFLMESSSIEYQVERNCELMQVGGWLDSKGYGIAMPVNYPFRSAISGAVLKMQEDGTLHNLKRKWWKEMYGGGACTEDKHASDNSAAELGLSNVGGVFVVLGGGVSVAFIIAIIEFLWNVRKIAVDEHVSVWEAFLSELKFALKVWITKKAIKTQLTEPSLTSKEE